MTEYDIARPYTAVFVIFRHDGKIAFVLRKNTDWMNNYYGLPAGKVEKNETFLEAAVREAKEEVGVDIDPQDLKLVLTFHRVHPDSTWVDIMFEAAQWKGEIYNAEPEVHGEVAWFDPTQLPDNIVPPVREALEAIERGETYLEKSYHD